MYFTLCRRDIGPAAARWSGCNQQSETRGTVTSNPEEADLRARLLDAERQSTELISEKERANEEAKRVQEELQQALGEIQFYKNKVKGLRAQYEKLLMQSELDKLSTLDLLRQECEERLADKRARANAKLRRSDSYISVIEEKFQFEKQGFEERVYALEGELQMRKRQELLVQSQGGHSSWSNGGACGSGSGVEREVSETDDDESGHVCVGSKV